jgi:putative ABC transport system permease protein
MRAIFQDLRFGFRLFLGSPGFTALTVLTLALGIAANTTVFSWIDSLLLRPFPGASDQGRLAVLEMVTQNAPNGGTAVSYVDYRDYRRNLKSLAGLTLHNESVFTLGDAGSAQPVWGELVSGNYFAVLGMRPALGRMFVPEEDGDRLGAYPVVVISNALWRRWFHGDPRAIGKTLRVNRCELTVVGVAPPDFRGTMPGLAFDLWIPVTMGRELGVFGDSTFRSRDDRAFYALARLQPGVEMTTARAEASAFARDLAVAYPKTNRGVSAAILPLWRFHSGAPELLSGPLRILMAIAVLLLLIVCANVANLLLARTMARRKELGVRLAMGAGGWRLARQLLTESMLLAGAAAVVGLILASWMGGALPALIPRIGIPVAAGFVLSGRVLAFTIAACVGTALLAATLPALVLLRTDVNETLKTAGRGNTGLHSHRLRGLLVVSEVALAALTLIVAGLFVRSFEAASSINPGFDRNNVVLGRFYIAGSGLSNAEVQHFCVRLRDRLSQSPAVEDVTYTDRAPLGTSAGPYSTVGVEGYVPARGESMNVNRYLVAPGYFRTMRIPLLEGRDFADRDDASAPPVMIVNQAFARRYFHGGNAVGRRVRLGREWIRVVGVARDSKYFNIAEAPRPFFYFPLRQYSGAFWEVCFLVRSARPPGQVAAELRRDVPAADARAGAFDVMLLTDWTDVTLLPEKTAASMAAALGLISLVLAAVGLYSVMAYAVAQRTREIGIRMALGAQPRAVLADVLQRGLALTAAGLALGVAGALAVTRLTSDLLVRVSANDPAAFAGAAAFLTLVAMLASYLPARRATHIDPMAALRGDE